MGDWEEVTHGKTPNHGYHEFTHRLRVEGGFIYRVTVEQPGPTTVALVFVPRET